MSQKFTDILALPDLQKDLQQVDDLLIRTVNIDPIIGKIIEPLVKAGGKRLRPILVLSCARLTNNKVSDATIKLGAVVELIHIASLVHDDIIDESSTRWGTATINSHNPNQAIVIGDYLFALACALAAEVNQQAAKLTALTISELCSGQSLELIDNGNLNRSEKNYFKTITGKTAALINLSCVVGGLSANLSDSQLKSLQDFGNNFGIAFQLIDDLMDLVSTEHLYGKPINNDIVEGVYTLPVILALQTDKAAQLRQNINKKSNEALLKLLFDTGAINKLIQTTMDYCHQASNSVLTFEGSVAGNLRDLPLTYLDWSINKYVEPKHKTKLKSIAALK